MAAYAITDEMRELLEEPEAKFKERCYCYGFNALEHPARYMVFFHCMTVVPIALLSVLITHAPLYLLGYYIIIPGFISTRGIVFFFSSFYGVWVGMQSLMKLQEEKYLRDQRAIDEEDEHIAVLETIMELFEADNVKQLLHEDIARAMAPAARNPRASEIQREG